MFVKLRDLEDLDFLKDSKFTGLNRTDECPCIHILSNKERGLEIVSYLLETSLKIIIKKYYMI